MILDFLHFGPVFELKWVFGLVLLSLRPNGFFGVACIHDTRISPNFFHKFRIPLGGTKPHGWIFLNFFPLSLDILNFDWFQWHFFNKIGNSCFISLNLLILFLNCQNVLSNSYGLTTGNFILYRFITLLLPKVFGPISNQVNFIVKMDLWRLVGAQTCPAISRRSLFGSGGVLV